MKDTRVVDFYCYDFKKELDSLEIDLDKPININKFEQIMQAKDKSLIVLDTNVLFSVVLNSYYAGLNILRILETCKNLIWIPHHVYREYNKNKARIFKSLIKKEDKLINLLKKSLESSKNDMQNKINTQLNIVDTTINELEKELNSKYDDLYNIIANYEDKLKNEVASVNTNNNKLKNELEKFVNELNKDNRISENIKFSEYLEILKEGETRYKYLIPPGYKDNCKGEKGDNIEEKIYNNKFGDLFIWKEILKLPEKMREERALNIENIIFITDDLKEDWWKVDNKTSDDKDQTLMRDELLLEFRESNPNTSISFMKVKHFYEYAAEIFDLYEFDTFVQLNKDDYLYLNRIKDSMIEDIKTQIDDDADKFFGYDFSGEGITSVKYKNCEFDPENSNVIFQRSGDVAYLTYQFNMLIELDAVRSVYAYCGNDEVEEIAGDNQTFQVLITLEVERSIVEDSLKNLVDKLNTDVQYSILSVELDNILNLYEDDGEQFTCPGCGFRFIGYGYENGGYCSDCSRNM